MKQRALVQQGKIWYLGTFDDANPQPKPRYFTVSLDAGFDLDVIDDDIYPVNYPSRLRASLTAAQAESIYVANRATIKQFPVGSTTLTPEQQLVTIYRDLAATSDIRRMGEFDYDFHTGEVTIKKASVKFDGRKPIPYKIAHVTGNFSASLTSNDEILKLPSTVDGNLTVDSREIAQMDFSRWVFKKAAVLTVLTHNTARINITFAPGAEVGSLSIISNTISDLRGFSRLIVTDYVMLTIASGTFSLDGLPENVEELRFGNMLSKVNILPLLLMRNPPKLVTGNAGDLIHQILDTVRRVPKAQRMATIKREMAGLRVGAHKDKATKIIATLR
jgi:hypothetical protein